jgi:pimeloyl-ACP methyl ester carboxylesterase
VPENREVPDSRLLRIIFTQIVAEASLEKDDDDSSNDNEEVLEARQDPIIYLTGGPGAGIELYVGRFLEHDLTKTRDLFILNQRGIGDSEELCPYYDSTSRELVLADNQKAQEIENAQRMKACFEAATNRGVDLSAYNTVENARDVRSLRQALGFDSWNVWGISYGSHLGQMLVNVDPEGIRALVLDAIVPNDLGDLMRIHRWIARNHKNVFTECARQGASICEGLEEAFYAAGNALIADPITVDAFDKELFPSGKANVPALIAAFAPFSMLYEQDAHPAIPSVMRGLVDMIENRDEQVFQVLANGDVGFAGISEGMGSAIRCNDGYMAAEASVAEEDLQEDFGFNEGAFSVEGSQLMADSCVEAGLAPRDRKDYQLIQSDIPTLVVNGDWDPVTPPALAERIAPGFSNGRLIIVPYAGHGPTRSMPECASQVLTDFFDNPSQNLDELDASCLEEGVEPPAFLDYMQTDIHLKLAARAMDEPKNVAVPGLIASTPIMVSLLGLIMISWGAITRRFSSSNIEVPGLGPATPRLVAFITALFLLLGVGLIGAGVQAAIEISEVSIIAGFAPPAGVGALLVLLAGLIGTATIVLTLKAHKDSPLRKRSLIGFVLLGLCAIVLSVIFLTWGITPW